MPSQSPLLPRLREQYVDLNSEVYTSAKLYFYLSGTTTPADTYIDAALTTPNTNPVVASAAGLFGTIYLDPSKVYKAVLKTSADVTVFTVDPVTVSSGQLLTVLAKTGNYTVSAADGQDVMVFVDASLGAVTITLYTAIGNSGRKVRVIKTDSSANAVTVDGNGGETINGALTYVLSAQYDALNIVSDNSNWFVLGAGSGLLRVLSKTATYTVTPQDGDDVLILVDASGAAVTINLYTAVGHKGRVIRVVKTETSANAVTLDANSTQTINGALTASLQWQYQAIHLASDGSNWVTLMREAPALSIATKTANYTAVTSDDLIVCTSGTFTVTLYSAIGRAGKLIRIKNSGSGVVTVDGNGTETIDGSLTRALVQYGETALVSDGANWVVVTAPNSASVGAYHNTTQSISDATATALLYNTEDFDNGGLHDVGSNTSRIPVVPVGGDGLYLITATASFAANGTGFRFLRIQKNGTTAVSGTVSEVGSASSTTDLCISALVPLVAGDYLEVIATQSSGGSLNVGHAATRQLQNSAQAVRVL